MDIGRQIKKARKMKGLTQVQLAEKANISRSYLGDIEGNRYHPSVDTLLSISNVLGIDVSFFLSDKNEPIDGKIDKLNNLDSNIDFDQIIDKISQLDNDDLIEFISFLDDLSSRKDNE